MKTKERIPLLKRQIKSALLHGSGIRYDSLIFEVSKKCVLNLIIHQGLQIIRVVPKKKHYERILIDELYSFVKHLNIKVDCWCTDAFEGFIPVLQRYQHLIGRQFNKTIEGQNTCIRARLARFQRRSTKFSKQLVYYWLNNQSSYI